MSYVGTIRLLLWEHEHPFLHGISLSDHPYLKFGLHYAFYLKMSDFSHIWPKRGQNDSFILCGVNKTVFFNQHPFLHRINLLDHPYLNF